MAKVPKKYTVRSGTQDSGRFYEFKMVALLSLRSIGENVQDMWILSNAGECKDFDDVVLYRETKSNNKTIYLIQLKHQDAGKNLTPEQFTAPSGKFSLAKYSKSLQELQKEIADENMVKNEIVNFLRTSNLNFAFILYTNKNIPVQNNEHQGNNNKATNFLSKVEDNENYLNDINSNKNNGFVYKFNYSELKFNVPAGLKYHNNFYLFVNQIDINHIDELILDELKSLFKTMKFSEGTLKAIQESYIDFIILWATGKLGGHYPLTKTIVINKLTEIVLVNYINIKRFDSIEYDLKTKRLTETDWKNILRGVPITVVDLDPQISLLLYEYVYTEVYFLCPKLPLVGLWYESFSPEAQTGFYNHYEKLKEEMLRTIGSFGKITLLDVYRCLWKTGQVPLILEAHDTDDYMNIMEIVRFYNRFNNLNLIIAIKTSKGELPKTSGLPNVFFNLDNLSGGKKKKILRCNIKLQDKFARIGNRIEKELYVHIKVKDIINILIGTFIVGNHFEKLPIYFINRFVTKIIIKPEVLTMLQEDLFSIRCYPVHFKNFVKNNHLVLENMLEVRSIVGLLGVVTIKSAKVLSFEFQHSRSRKPNKKKSKAFHELILLEDKYLEWLKSTPTIEKIKKFRDNTELTNNHYKIDDYLNNTINLISAGPGMGKSMLMDYIALAISETKWVLKINLSEHLDYYEKKEFGDSKPQILEYLCYFNRHTLIKHKCQNVFNEEIFYRYANAGDVVVILDGFDEISITHKKEVTQLAKCLRHGIYSLWITTRPSMKAYLEETFGVFSISLNLFNKKDQLDFLTKFYYNSFDKTDTVLRNVTKGDIQEFVLRLSETTTKKLNKWDYEFTGIPLQTRLLAEVFQKKCVEYVQTKNFTLTDHFDLLYLYEQFIDQKSKIFAEKVQQIYAKEFSVAYGKFQKLYALKILFKKEDLKALDVEGKLKNFNETIDKAIEFIQKDGIIIAEDEVNINFVHRTFAEYLAAKWIYENCLEGSDRSFAQSLLKKTFDPSYQVLRNIFDRMMARNLQLHEAIINLEFDKVKNIVKSDPKALAVTDLGGRSPLHLAASWGIYHPTEDDSTATEHTSINPITRFILENNSNADPMIDITNKLLKCPDKKDTILQLTPLDYAVISNSLAVLNSLLEKTKKLSFIVPDTLLSFLLYYGCSLNYLSLVRHIFKQLKSKDKIKSVLNSLLYDDKTLLQCAVTNGHLKVLSELLQNGASVNISNKKGITALHAAVDSNNTSCVEFLLSKGAKINQDDDNGNTPLHHSAMSSSTTPDVLKLLLSNEQIETEKVNKKGETALLVAARNGSLHTLNILTSKRANLHARDSKGRGILHKAIDSFTTENMSFLLLVAEQDFELDINFKDHKGRTALHKAAKKNNVSAVEFLVRNGARYSTVDNNNCTPLKLARTAGAFEVVEYLEKCKR